MTGAFSRTKRNSFRLRGVTSFYTLTICHSLWLLSPTAMLLLVVVVVVFNFVPLSPIFRQTRLRRSNDFVGPTYVLRSNEPLMPMLRDDDNGSFGRRSGTLSLSFHQCSTTYLQSFSSYTSITTITPIIPELVTSYDFKL